jgi:SpoVK/Ycf46/Vps4 family AAA+-type ATPase
VWIDEIEKSGIAHTNDSNGINADALGLMLSHIEDHNSYCVSLTGLPGTGKSLIAKTVGPEFGRMVIRMDLGAMKGSFVGESESNLRAALRLITALSDDNALFVATSNSVNGLDTALRSRFVDTFYFPLPSSEELAPVWDVHKAKYGIDDENPDDTNWVPRNVKQCCEKSYRLGMDLSEAAFTIIPTGVSMAKEVNKLNEQAHGRFLSASTGEKFEYMGAFNED